MKQSKEELSSISIFAKEGKESFAEKNIKKSEEDYKKILE